MILILDYGVGNVNSINSMIKKIGFSSTISNRIEDIERAQRIIISGVGSFDKAVNNLSNYREVLSKRVMLDRIPVLGICLGMQLMTDASEEGSESGLSWIKANVIRFKFTESSKLKIPHMSWNHIRVLKSSKLMEGIDDNFRFYFAHSYYVSLGDKNDGLSSTNYGFDFISSFERDNIVGVQFHPEKSHKYGMKLLSNFIKNY